MKLVLFDIDGTLLSAAGAGRRAIKQALAETVGEVPAADTWMFAGKTDPQLTRELLVHHGVEESELPRLIDEVLARYLAYLGPMIAAAPDAHLKPGVLPLLAELSRRPNVVVALLTGNHIAGARLKLEHFGIAEHFELGAYGSDHAHRPELPAIAVARAQAQLGHAFEGKDIIIIGDTEHDVTCGAALGVRAIAVATGPYDVAALTAHGADHVFADLSDTEAVLAAILA